MTVERARRHLARLAAAPRPAGSPAEADARRYCAETLGALGFRVSEEPFEYSTLPGRWATPAAGALSIAALAAAGHVGSRGAGALALSILVATGAIAAPVALWLARHGVLRLPIARARATNLRAVRGPATPSVWLVAHLDSKSQPVPIAARALGIMGSAIAWIAALAVAIAQLAGAPLAEWWIWITALGGAAGLPVVASVVGARSPGAVDNASGVAAVLTAAELLDQGTPFGVLITSAEELGLAGARAAAAVVPRALALNCDTVDDGAPLLCLVAGRPGRAADAIATGGGQAGVPLIVRRLLPGVLVDAVALADAGWDCATLSAATWRTLARVHTERDTLDQMRGDGVAIAGRTLAEALRALGEN